MKSQSIISALTNEEIFRIREEVGRERFDRGRFREARAIFEGVAASKELQDFLTIPAYDALENC